MGKGKLSYYLLPKFFPLLGVEQIRGKPSALSLFLFLLSLHFVDALLLFLRGGGEGAASTLHNILDERREKGLTDRTWHRFRQIQMVFLQKRLKKKRKSRVVNI